MTNSLIKDSHIPLYCRPMSTYDSGQGAGKNKERLAVEKSSIVNNNAVKYNNKPVDKTNFCGFFRAPKNSTEPARIFTNNKVKSFLNLAADKPSLYNAVFSLLLTCVMRPATIMVLPSDKKNKDDKKYAAAHSVASGIIGYGIASILFNPIGNAMKNIAENFDKFAKKYPKIKYLAEDNHMFRAKKYFGMLPDILAAAPRAMLTVALIPPILKYVFGWEKKKTETNKASKLIAENPELVNFKNSAPQNVDTNAHSAKPSFTGSEKLAKYDGLSNIFAKWLSNDKVKAIIEKSKSKNLAAHFTAITGVTLSGFYMQQTLKNKKLDEEKRKTLAINQGLVCVISTFCAYAIEKALDARITKFTDKFKEVNVKESASSIAKYADGIKVASSVMIFAAIYRYFAPVLATPIANKIGNVMQSKKAAEQAKTENK